MTCSCFIAWFASSIAVANNLPNFATIDTNNNGELSVSEFVTAELSPDQFKAADVDGNQRVSAGEYTQFQRRTAKQQRRPGSGPHPPRG